ncbi:release factor glutamine methyltransferase [Lentilactobacillus sunkii]|jgi:release factor glutamine methyltransferase|uniref:Release factor glutamine methyltransferase n=1 Tax=Lentilactobacillus sunkii TaxID=481719 RepID=A0A1E7XD91_9LACO|nr:peptide chain release factor N(5)-glutamine methyltransferase [Lentilactobacillus sunkii]OFA11083.1 release factor glutamine methyltransferase [Lentilactobacillus sunkii]
MNNQTKMTYFEARKWASFRVKDASDIDMYDVDFLLEKLFNLSATELLIKYQSRMPDDQWQQFQSAVGKLMAGVPPQYIVGKADFYGLTLTVTPDVLIPRVETEELVDWVLSENSKNDLKVLDIGTGSGAIAIALKKFRSQWNVTASDISEKAIEVAKDNALANKTAINFVLSDVFDSITGGFDIIVSNPPYIAKDEQAYMDRSVINNEPDLALYAEDEGLAVYRKIAEDLKDHLNTSGKLYMEIGFKQESAVSGIFKRAISTAQVIPKHDVAGHQRMIQVKK